MKSVHPLSNVTMLSVLIVKLVFVNATLAHSGKMLNAVRIINPLLNALFYSNTSVFLSGGKLK